MTLIAQLVPVRAGKKSLALAGVPCMALSRKTFNTQDGETLGEFMLQALGIIQRPTGFLPRYVVLFGRQWHSVKLLQRQFCCINRQKAFTVLLVHMNNAKMRAIYAVKIP